MKKTLLFLVISMCTFAGYQMNAQVTGSKNVPGDYPDLAAAIADLNAVGVGAGGATINLLAGNPQTAPLNGYQLGSAVLNPTLIAGNPLVFNGNGNTITANTGLGLYDAIFTLMGADYVTINNLNLAEAVGNVNSTMWMEWGYALLKRQNVSPVDGCQNNVIQNCTITLNKANGLQGYGIYGNNHIAGNNLQLTVSAAGDANSNNTFRANTIQNSNSGILMQGANNLTFYDQNNMIGGTSAADGNIIQNFGNGAVAMYGIYTFYQNNLTIQNNNVNNMAGGGVASTSTQYGIYTATATFNGFYTIRKNTVNMTQGSTGILYLIYNTAGNTNNQNTINMDSNDVKYTHLTTGSTTYGIYNAGSCATLNMNANIMDNVTTPCTGTTYLFYIAGTVYTAQNVNDNKITNYTRTGTAGTTYGFYEPGPAVGNINVTSSVQRNKVDRMFYSNVANTGIMYPMYMYRGSCVKTVKYDTVVNCRNNTGTNYNLYFYNFNGGELSNNFVANDTSAGTQGGLFMGSSTYTNTAVADNIITGLYGTGVTSTTYGLYCSGGTNLNIQRNNIYNIQKQITTSGAVYGMYVTAGVSVNIFNNFISDLRTPVATSTSPIYGIYFSGGGAFKLFHNTIKLDPVSVGPNFGAIGIYFTVIPSLDLRNNIIHVNAIPMGTGFVAALRKSAGVAGTPPATGNIAATTNSNIYYVPALANSYWYAEGTANPLVNGYNLINDPNMNTSCATYKIFMSPRESSSFNQNNLSAVAVNPPTWAPTGSSFGKSNAVATASPAVTTDYVLAVRGNPADCGALEFGGTAQDAVGPSIAYTPITSISNCGGLPILTAPISDLSGINVAAGTKPRVYYKKSTDNNAYVGNTNIDNGWKWVEASNAVSPFTFQLNPALLMSAPVLGDVIQYFVVAQDNVVLPNPNVSANLVAFASGYCPISVNLLPGAFPTGGSPAVNSMTVVAPSPIALTTSGDPINVCNPGTTTLSVADTITTVLQAPTLMNGTLYSGFAKLSNCNLTGYSMGLAVFIDYNRNGIFDLPNERAFGSPATLAGGVTPNFNTYPFSFTVDPLALSGPTLMRIVVVESTAGISIPATGTYNWGETEDYLVYLNSNVGAFPVGYGASNATSTADDEIFGIQIVGTNLNTISSCLTNAGPAANGLPASMPAQYSNYTNLFPITIVLGNSLPTGAFNWAPGAGILTNPNRTVTATNIVANTVYTVTATDGGGCTATSTVAINMAVPMSAISVTGTTAYCNDVPNTTLTFNTTGGSSPINTIWTGGPVVTVPTEPVQICQGATQSGFVGAYMPANWTTLNTNSNGTVNAGGAPANIIMTSGDNGSFAAGTTEYTIVANCTGNLTFNWLYQTADGAAFDQPKYRVNGGAATNFPGFNAGGGAATQFGSASIPVVQGQTFTFQAWTLDNVGGPCTITVNTFVAPTTSPTMAVSGNTAVVNPPAGTTIYTITAVDPCGNTVSTTVSVVVTVPPVPTLVTATPSTVCPGATSNLNATSPGNQIIYYDQAVGGIPLGFAASGVNFPVTPLATTTYYASAASQFLPSGSQTFNYTGAPQTFIVPPGVTSVTINAFGAQGFGQPGAVAPISVPGNGGRAQGLMAVTPGQVLTVYVGGQGAAPSNGWNGGGLGKGGVNGGGASDVRTGGVALGDRVIVAGGGGGAGGDSWQCLVGGGHGGGGIAVGSNFVGGGGGAGYTSGTGCGTDGGNAGGIGGTGTHGGGGGGGGLIGGGTGAVGAGPAFPGTLGQGGASFDGSSCTYTGGGGGGYYGGGGASGNNCGAGRGGGGSSWTGSLLNPVFQGGVQTGNGQVIISWSGGTICESARVPVTVTTLPAPVVTATANPLPACSGLPLTLTSSGAQTYLWNPGALVGSPAVAPAPLVATTYTVTGTDAVGCTASATVAVTVLPTPDATITQSPAGPLACGVLPTLTAPIGQVVPPNGARYYIRDADPWGSASFTTGMNAVFGAGNWTALTYAAALPGTIFVPGTQFVYLEGSSGTEAGQTAYLAANLPAIEAWVNAGGRLLINRGPNSGGNTNFGFGGVTNNYNSPQGTVNVVALDPIGAGPFLPSGYGPYTGSSYSHAHITGGGTTPMITGGGVNVLTKLNWGAGLVLFGGYTAPSFHPPAPKAQNLFQNWISYCATSAQGAPLNYVWQPGGATTQSITAPATGVYTVTVTQGSCSSTGTISVTINSNPVVTANPATVSVCSGGTATLSGGGDPGVTYSWSGGITDGVAFTPVATTTYTVTGTNGAGCTATATAVVTVNPVLAGTGSASPAAICLGGSTTITGAATTLCAGNVSNFAGIYAPANWTNVNVNSNGTVNTGGAPANIIMSSGNNFGGLPGTTNYSIPMTCSGNVTFNWAYNHADAFGSIFDYPRYTINGGLPVVFSGFIVGGGNSQTGAQTIAVNTGDILELQMYTIDNDPIQGFTTISNFSAPDAAVNGTAAIWDSPSGGVNLGASPQTVTPAAAGIVNYYVEITSSGPGSCVTPTRIAVPVTVNSFTNLIPNASPASICLGGSSVLSSNAVTNLWNPGALTGSPTVTPAVTTTYSLTGTDANGCTATATIDVTVNGLPTVTASASPSAICPGGSAVLTGGGAATYAWDPGALVGSPTVTPGATTTYSVVGTDANGCTGTATVDVTVYTSPVVTASASPSTICEGSSSVLTGGGAATYAWDPGALVGSPTVTPIVTTTYSVTGTDANGCTGTATVDVTVNPAPVLVATATPATTCNQTVVTPSASGAPTIVWTGGVTNNVPFIATATTTYTVTGTSGLGCDATTTVVVTVNPMSGILAPATTNQTQDHGDDFNVNYYDASCDLIATVDDGAGGNILGLTTSTVTVDPGFGVHNGQPFVRRWYQITPTNNGAADVILYINQSDFDNYNSGVALPYLPLPTTGNNADPNIPNIRITKNTDAGLGNSPVVITPTVNWNGTYWELSFNTPSFSQFRVHSVNPGNVPLPATVTSFSGVKLESADKLSWTTSSEQNNAFFNLQHSTDGSHFTTLAKVNSKAPNGNSSVALNYSSINSKPSLGHNYYRLQQVDMDGKVSVHAQIVDLIWGATGSTVSIYPNPTTDILNIDLYAVNDQNTTVKLLDMSGRVIKQIQAKSAVGMNNIKLSMGEIASGVYTIQVYENNTLSHTSKVKKND
ncbi:MAG: T9SS type A sorting domain-containing protein [Bacteroidetes bacterium]|nr:T9SS type A sorting domain-containing protein [Bacteroidota bacterium]